MTISAGPTVAQAPLAQVDPELWDAMSASATVNAGRSSSSPARTMSPQAVLEAQGSWLTNKYAEGLPGKRYYGGCEFVDVVERLAQERALALFPGSEHVNVQPHSGAQANMAAYFSVLKPGDRILGMNLAHGGHLTHGMALNFSGKLYEVHAYGVREDDQRIDYDALERQAGEVRPKMIVAGASAYPADHRLRAHGGHRPRRGRAAVRGHGPYRGPRRGGTPSQPVPPRGPGHDHHPQDAARAARRHHVRASGPRRGRGQGGLPGYPGWPPDARHRGQGRGLQAGPRARVPRGPAADHRERPGACRRPSPSTAPSWSRAAPTTT